MADVDLEQGQLEKSATPTELAGLTQAVTDAWNPRSSIADRQLSTVTPGVAELDFGSVTDLYGDEHATVLPTQQSGTSEAHEDILLARNEKTEAQAKKDTSDADKSESYLQKASNVQKLCAKFQSEVAEALHKSQNEVTSDNVRSFAVKEQVKGDNALAASLISAYRRDDYRPFWHREKEFPYWAADNEEKMRAKADDKLLKPASPGQIDGEHIRQDYPDSCNFITSLIGLTRQPGGPDKIMRMVSEKQDGSYTVRFPGAEKPIHVGKLTEAEKLYGSTDDRGYLYVAVLEKAYGQYLNEKQPSNERTVIPADGARFGMSDDNAGLGMKLLTGHDSESFNTARSGLFANSKDDIARALSQAEAEKLIITAGIKAPPEPNPHHLHPNHAYSIEFQDGKIVLRDPLKTGKDSLIPTNIDELYNNFNVIRVEQKR
ncbi:MAG TPA: hypothetical protein V6D08_16910 [Candidatus Obscuribacterales bacterium]